MNGIKHKLPILCLIYSVLLIFGCHGKSKLAAVPIDGLSAANTTPTKTVSAAPKTAKVKFSSVYTKLDAQTCQPIRQPKNDEDEVADVCRGYKDYKVFVEEHGAMPRIYVGREISPDMTSWEPSALPSFILNDTGKGRTIEWRLADGEPFACIVRAEYDKQLINPDEKGTANELVIKNLKGFAPIDIVIDARQTTRANEEAQKRADAAYGKP
jgi:hypothetical protein